MKKITDQDVVLVTANMFIINLFDNCGIIVVGVMSVSQYTLDKLMSCIRISRSFEILSKYA
jgi:hypothetical protein